MFAVATPQCECLLRRCLRNFLIALKAKLMKMRRDLAHLRHPSLLRMALIASWTADSNGSLGEATCANVSCRQSAEIPVSGLSTFMVPEELVSQRSSIGQPIRYTTNDTLRQSSN